MPIKKPDDFENDIDKRKPKPFRYLKNDEFVKENGLDLDKKNYTYMKTDKSNINIEEKNQVVLSNNKNISKIEDIIKKHEDIKKLKL